MTFARGLLSQARGQQVLEENVFRSALMLCKGGQRGLHAFAELIGTGAGFRTQAYQAQHALPDRHAVIIVERPF